MKVAVVLALTLTPVVVSAQQAPQPNPQAETKKPGSIAGIVVNAKTGEPIRRANLTLHPTNMPGMMAAPYAAPAAPYAVSSDPEGKFRIDNIEPGNYRLMAERQGFVRYQYGARTRSMVGTTLTIAPGQAMANLRLEMIPQAIITGRVLDEEGEPLARVQIQVLRQQFYQGRKRLMPGGGAQSDDTGAFRVADLAPGRYWIKAIYRGDMMMFGQAPRNTGDQPEMSYVETYYPGTIDESGATPIDVTAGQELPGLDIRMQKARVYRIRGKVVGATEPLRNVRLMLVPRERNNFMFMGPGTGGVVREDGTFEIGNVQPGSYHVTVFPMRGMHSLTGKAAVDVGQENVDEVALMLAAAGTLKGSIRVQGDVEQLEKALGKKLSFAGLHVRLQPVEGFGFNNPFGQAKDDGSFVLENVGADKYRIFIAGLPKGTWLKSVRVADQEVLDSGFDVAAGTSPPVQITIGVGAGTVSGIVEDEKQQPATGTMVTLLPIPMKEGRQDLYRFGATDQKGQFTLEGVAPGEYRLYAWEDIDPGAYTDPEFLKPYESKGQKITMKEGGQEQVKLTRIPAVEQ
jgi:hypothetical protein